MCLPYQISNAADLISIPFKMNTKMPVVDLNHQLKMIDVELSLARQTDNDYAEQRTKDSL